LFVDRLDIERRENVTRTFHSAARYGDHPVLKQEAPWEHSPGMTASVVYDAEERLFKAWYMAGFYAEGSEHVQCMATSTDGIHWERPKLGLHEALGTKENNIVIPSSYHEGKDHWESMLKDPMDPAPQRRYKALGWSSYDWDGPLAGIYSATSPDGLNWSHTPEPVFHFHPRPGTKDLGPVGDAQALMIDTRKKRYVACLRGGPTQRLFSVSEDFVMWTPPKPCLCQLHEEETLYNHVGFVYGDQYLGILTHFDRRPTEQTQTLRLINSRDGENWTRPAAESLIPTGDFASWDRFQILLTGAPPIRVGDRLYIYYRGTNRRHAKVEGEFEPRIARDQDIRAMSIGLATIRLDGFASMDGSFDGGSFTVRPALLSGESLSVNIKCDYGQAFVELLDMENRPLPGFTREECAPLSTDSVDARIRWSSGRPLTSLAGQPVKIRFYLYNARLYSYRCVGAQDRAG
jgi:hypothetical protein